MTMVTKKFNSVWDALEITKAEAVNMNAKAELIIALHEVVVQMGLTQAKASEKLGISQHMLDDLLKGRINSFSFDALFELASRAGLEIHLQFKKITIPFLATSLMKELK